MFKSQCCHAFIKVGLVRYNKCEHYRKLSHHPIRPCGNRWARVHNMRPCVIVYYGTIEKHRAVRRASLYAIEPEQVRTYGTEGLFEELKIPRNN